MNSTDQSGDVSLADLIGETAGKQVNEKLDDLHCDPVRDEEEAKVAAAAYKEQDADGAANLVPLGIAGLALIVSASKTVGLLAIGIVLIIIYYVAAALMRRDKRSTSAARAVMDRRLATGRPLLSKGVREERSREDRDLEGELDIKRDPEESQKRSQS